MKLTQGAAHGAIALLLACGSSKDDGESVGEASTGSSTGRADHHGGTEPAVDDSTSSTTADASSSEAETSSGATTSSSSSTGAPVMDTWENWAYPEYFTPYCLECHPGQSSRDFNMYEVVVENVEHIRCGSAPEMLPDCNGHIEPGHLPIGDGPFPSDDERWRLVDWIDAGMPRDP